MKELKAITTVYSYYFPEVRKAISELVQPYPHGVFLKSVYPGLDDFHSPIIQRYLDFQSDSVPRLRDFMFRYPTAGAEEGIREFLTLLQTQGTKRIYVLKGEYEGYKAVGITRGIETVELEPDADPDKIERGVWFISNPSAKDGNIIQNDAINRICEAGHHVFYDLTYLGSTEPYVFDLSHPNILAAVVSFSKPFGLFYYRVGFAFSRMEIPSLYGNKWFKNIFSLLVADKIMSSLAPMYLPSRYLPVQKQIIDEINMEHGLGIRPSDALLLGYLRKDDAEKLSRDRAEMIKRFQRGDGYRFCLTPYYEGLERENQ